MVDDCDADGQSGEIMTATSRNFDLNADLGEGYGPWAMGDDAAMLDIVTSANVACGGHASDPETMFRTLVLARERGIVVGAHPSYPDKEGFGRRRLGSTPAEIEHFVAAQIGALSAIGGLADIGISYVKPHGALANVAAAELPVAQAILRAARAADPALAILAMSGTVLEIEAREQGFTVYSEVFADRGYTDEGTLVPRGQLGDLIHDPDIAAQRILDFADSGLMPSASGKPLELKVDSICIHGDSPRALAMARHVRSRLLEQNITLRPFMSAS